MNNQDSKMKDITNNRAGLQDDADTENAKNIAYHKQAAAHHAEAAKLLLAAATHHENGDHDEAARNTVLAYGHAAIAGGFVTDDAKHHAQTLKETRHR